MFHVVAMGAAVEHETVADDLHEFRVQFFSNPSPASLAVRPDPSSTEHLMSSRFSMVSSACLMAFSLRSFLPTWMSGLSLVARLAAA